MLIVCSFSISRTDPSCNAAIESITVEPRVTEDAAEWIVGQLQETCLLKSWQEEEGDPAWLYDQALGLIVLTDTILDAAKCLADRLRVLQNTDGSWNSGYHATSTPITSIEPITQPVGSNAWTVYAITWITHPGVNGEAFINARQGAQWLADMQFEDGSVPDVPGSAARQLNRISILGGRLSDWVSSSSR